MKTLSILSLVVLFASCSSGWTDEKRQIIVDKCDSDTYDCDCFVENTVVFFPDPEAYNTTLENEEVNADKIDEYYEGLNDCKKPDVWDMIYGKCDTNIYDCDCFVENTVVFFPDPETYNTTLENEEENADKINEYYEVLNDCKKPDVWDMIYGNCDTNIYDCDCFLEITMEFYPEGTAFLKDLQNEANSTETLKSYREVLDECEINKEE